MLTFNTVAYKELRHLLFVNHLIDKETDVAMLRYLSSIDEQFAVTDKTFSNWFVKGRIPILRLISLCNKLRFPFALFFSWNNATETRNYRLIDEDKWIDVTIRFDYMINDMKVRCQLKRKDIISKYGMTSTYSYFENNDTKGLQFVTMETLIACLEDSRLSPEIYIRDLNERLPIVYESDVMACDYIPHDQIDNLRSENISLQISLEELRKDLERLQKNNSLLEDDRNDLLRKQREDAEQHVRDSARIAELTKQVEELNNKIFNHNKYLKASGK